jgi:hypothetical protein
LSVLGATAIRDLTEAAPQAAASGPSSSAVKARMCHDSSRLRGARAGTASPAVLPGPQTVRRRISVRGVIMIGGQRIQVGFPHAGKTAEITVETDTYQITVDDGVVLTAPCTTSRDILRHKASNYPAG